MRKLLFAGLLVCFQVSGQVNDQSYLLKYKQAVQEYASQNFEEAMVQLAPLVVNKVENPVAPYAAYYFSLAAFEAKKNFQSREMLRKLFERYPDWEKIEDAYYLYANANFVDGYYEEGIAYLERIDGEDFKILKENLLNHHLQKVNSVSQLKQLIERFPNERMVAVKLVELIQDRPYNSKEDLELSDLLTNRFKLVDKQKESSSNGQLKTSFARAFDDSTMDFGVILPFELLVNANKNTDLKNQYVYDMYAGMKIAEEELQNEGVPIRLFGIDVGSDAADMKSHLEDPRFRKMDLIFGPLYPRPNRTASVYAKKNKVIQVHPLSNSSALIQDQPNVFLVQPSFKIQAEQTIDFALENEWNKTCMIYFEPGKKDSLLAYVYKNEAEARGIKVLEIKSVGLETVTKRDLEVGHVFLTGGDTFGPMMIRKLDKNKVKGSMLVTSTSFDFQKVTRSTLDREIYFVYPEYVDQSKSTVKVFKEKYMQEMNIIPSYFSYLGYDMVKFYAMMLKDGKEIFRYNLNDSQLLSDFNLSGFDYSGGQNENQKVPIIKWENGEFEVLK